MKTATPAAWNRFFQMVLLACMLVACGKHKADSAPVQSEEWVYTHIKHGMTEKQVIDVAGAPIRIEKEANNTTELFYLFDILPPKDNKMYFSGYQVLLSNDSVDSHYAYLWRKITNGRSIR
jgi:hypothetical protein